MSMPTKLSSVQTESYARDGFLSPIAALTGEQAAYYRGKLEAFEKAVGGPLTSDGTDPRYRSRTHVLLTWVHALARHPAILGAVEDLIGPDILVYTPPGSSRSRRARRSPPGIRTRRTSDCGRTSTSRRGSR